MRKAFGILAVLLLVAALCFLAYKYLPLDSRQPETTTEYVEPATTLPAETEPPYRLMEITANTLNIRSGPGSGFDVVGQLHKGDQVQVWQEEDGWGQIDQGWISLDYAKDCAPQPEPPTNPGTSGQPEQGTDPNQSDTPSQDQSSALWGTWYRFYPDPTGISDYWVASREYRRDGTIIDRTDFYYVDTERFSNNGYSDGRYTYDGKQEWVDMPPYAYGDYFPVRISGNTMYWGSDSIVFYRVSLEELKAMIRRDANPDETDAPDTEPPVEETFPPVENTALVGSWYRPVALENWGYVAVFTFDAKGNAVDAQIQYVPENPSPSHYMGAFNLLYTYDGTTLTTNNEGDVRVYTVSVNGNQFTINGDTYRRGTVEDGFAELAKIFKPSQPDDTTPETDDTTPEP